MEPRFYPVPHYAAAVRRRIWLPIAMAVAAAIVTALYIMLPAPLYQATATVVVPALSGREFTTSAVNQYVTTYSEVLASDPVVLRLARDTGLTPSALVHGLEVNQQVAASNVIAVNFAGTSKAQTPKVVHDAALLALDEMVQPQIAQAQSDLGTSGAAIARADKGLADFTASTGLLAPDDEFKTKQQELSQLRIQVVQARESGNAARATGLQALVDKRQKEVADLGPEVSQYDRLLQAKRVADGAYTLAAGHLQDAQALIAANHAPSTMTVKNDGKLSRVQRLVRFGGVGFSVGALLGIAILVIAEMVRFRRLGGREAWLRQQRLRLMGIGDPA